MMKQLALILCLLILVGCTAKGPAPAQQTDPLPLLPVILEVKGTSVRPGGTAVVDPGPSAFNLRFSEAVDAKSVRVQVNPTALQVRPNLDQPDTSTFQFSLEATGAQPEEASITLQAAKSASGRALVAEPQVYQLKFRPAIETPAPIPTSEPSLTVWAVDPTGKRAPEVLLSRPDPLVLLGASPDGRYWLLERLTGQPQDASVPCLYDRQTGQLREGTPMVMLRRAVAWSGKGFWVDWLVHLNLDLSVESYPQLRATLGLTGKTLLAASFTADGRKVAMLAMHENADTADLILANSDGTGAQRVDGIVQPWWGKAGDFAYLSLSPSGDRAILLSQLPGNGLIDTARLAREYWKPVLSPFVEPGSPGASSGPPGEPVWAPDGKHLWFPAETVLSREGEVVTRVPGPSSPGVWNGDGSALVTSGDPGTRTLRLVTVDGQIREFEQPDWGTPVAFLPDGRVLISRTTFQQ